jgi:hypothetical protein
MTPPRPDKPRPQRQEGFSLESITWGYRDIFARSIEELFAQDCLGPKRQDVTRTFFELLKQADQACFDHVLRQFLGSLNPQNRWIMNLPALFADFVECGAALGQQRLYEGMRFFQRFANGALGSCPAEVRFSLDRINELRRDDSALAMAFLDGLPLLRERMARPEIDRYLDVARQIHHADAERGYAFMRGELASCEEYIRSITREARLQDCGPSLERFLLALTGEQWTLQDLGELDSDDLLERNAQVVCVQGNLYLPRSIRWFDRAGDNRNAYRLMSILAAACWGANSFPRIHGHAQYQTCATLAGQDPWRENLFLLVESLRVCRWAVQHWPGARRLIEWGLAREAEQPGGDIAAILQQAGLTAGESSPGLEPLCRVADESVNCFDTAGRLSELWAEPCKADGRIARSPLRPCSFLPDFLFPMSFSSPPPGDVIADLKDAAQPGAADPNTPPEQGATSSEDGSSSQQPDTTPQDGKAAAAADLYDEWDVHQNDYRPRWCQVRMARPEAAQPIRLDDHWMDQARQVRTMFERLKPDLARREKYLAEGDDINTDRLVEYLVDRRHQPCPPVQFYEKPLIQHRDLAVLVLLDLSGSTGQDEPRGKVLDVEKQTAVVLGEGLESLGDRFAVCGFSSHGRQQCDFLMFKSFQDAWSPEAIGRLLSAWPRNSTRIGPALRHAGFLLAQEPHRQRLILLVTDGKPMDEGYDPNTGYAQHDVRMACEENEKHEIRTFAISTDENTQADMQLMFPRRRFLILPGLDNLPRMLPEFYLKLTL